MSLLPPPLYSTVTCLHTAPSCRILSFSRVLSKGLSANYHIQPRSRRRLCTANARVRNRSTTATTRKRTAAENEDEVEEEDYEEEEEEGHKEEGSVDAEVVEESKGSYPNMYSFLEEAFKDDREIQEIIEKSFEAPEEMGKRVTERVKRKEKDLLQPKTGSAVPMKVSFRDFDATDSHIWMELYNSPSEKDIDIIGSVIRSWYLLGCLGGYNSLNMQLTRIPINERLSYNENVEDDILPARFNNIGELEFQHNWGRFWVDLGTSDPLALDVFVNSFTAVSSEHEQGA
eukprot:c24359_g1_i3 orf=662-1522(-)